jgi:penicillin-insensitive murein endopeptidase
MLVRRRAGGFVAAAAALVAAALAAVAAAVPLGASPDLRMPDARELTSGLAGIAALQPTVVTRREHQDDIPPVKTAHPLDGMKPLDVVKLIREHPDKIGSASLGVPTRGALWGGAQLLPSDILEPASSEYAWGTRGTITAIERAVALVQRRFPDSPKLFVGDISTKRGGGLRPHRSHQSGLDADIGFYYSTGPTWYQAATADNLDAPRTWGLIKALIEVGNVEYMFMDYSVQALLKKHAESIHEDPVFLLEVFQHGIRADTVIRHAHGHRTHFHVRFDDPEACETGARIYPYLQAAGLIWLPPAKRGRRR